MSKVTYFRERYNAPVHPPSNGQLPDWLRKELAGVHRGIPHDIVVDLRDFGIRGNKTTDDTSPIQKALTEAPEGATVLFPRPVSGYACGKVSIAKSLRILGHGSLLSGMGHAIFCVTGDCDWLTIEGFEVDFPDITGDTGKEFFVNASATASATLANFGANATTFAEYATINDIGRLTIRDCRLGFSKVSVAGTSDGTHVTIKDNHWEHVDGVHAAPTYLELYGVKNPIVKDNRWKVYAPDGENKDIVKIWFTGAEDFVFQNNRVHNLNTACTLAEVDIFYGGARAQIDGNNLINVNLQAKVWGPPPNTGYDYKALSVTNNTFVRESGFDMVGSWEGTPYDVALFLMATRFNVQGNRFVDLNAAGDPLTAIYLGRSTGAPPPDFDSLSTRHCRAFTVMGNTASFTHGNNEGAFIRWRNNDATDLEADGAVVGNVQHGGRYFWEANEQNATRVAVVGNVWKDPDGTVGALGLAAPCMIIANDFPATLSLAAANVIVDYESAKITLDGTDGTVAAGSTGIAENGGSLQLSSRQNVQVFLDNDNNGTNAFSIYSGVTAPGTPLFEFHEGGYFEAGETTDPSSPGANRGRMYFKDNGAGKTQLVALFPTGVVQVIATEP